MAEKGMDSSQLDPVREALVDRAMEAIAQKLPTAIPRPYRLAVAEAVVDALPDAQAAERLAEALEEADMALTKARAGLDLGLGCARDLERDYGVHPISKRSMAQAHYLRTARLAQRKLRAVLSAFRAGSSKEGQ